MRPSIPVTARSQGDVPAAARGRSGIYRSSGSGRKSQPWRADKIVGECDAGRKDVVLGEGEVGRELESRWILLARGDVDYGVGAREVSRLGAGVTGEGVGRCGLGVGVANIAGTGVVVVVRGNVVVAVFGIGVLGVAVPWVFDGVGVGIVAGLVGDSTWFRHGSYKQLSALYQESIMVEILTDCLIDCHGSAALVCRRSLSFRNKREGQQEDVECRNHREGRERYQKTKVIKIESLTSVMEIKGSTKDTAKGINTAEKKGEMGRGWTLIFVSHEDNLITCTFVCRDTFSAVKVTGTELVPE